MVLKKATAPKTNAGELSFWFENALTVRTQVESVDYSDDEADEEDNQDDRSQGDHAWNCCG